MRNARGPLRVRSRLVLAGTSIIPARTSHSSSFAMDTQTLSSTPCAGGAILLPHRGYAVPTSPIVLFSIAKSIERDGPEEANVGFPNGIIGQESVTGVSPQEAPGTSWGRRKPCRSRRRLGRRRLTLHDGRLETGAAMQVEIERIFIRIVISNAHMGAVTAAECRHEHDIEADAGTGGH